MQPWQITWAKVNRCQIRTHVRRNAPDSRIRAYSKLAHIVIAPAYCCPVTAHSAGMQRTSAEVYSSNSCQSRWPDSKQSEISATTTGRLGAALLHTWAEIHGYKILPHMLWRSAHVAEGSNAKLPPLVQSPADYLTVSPEGTGVGGTGSEHLDLDSCKETLWNFMLHISR